MTYGFFDAEAGRATDPHLTGTATWNCVASAQRGPGLRRSTTGS